MNSKNLVSAGRALVFLLSVSATCALAQDHRPVHFSGLINDYSPLNASVKNSPWEMHGQWTLDVHLESGTADFSADMTMSGFGKTASGQVDPTQPLQNPHTHHIRLKNAKITWNMTGCPSYQPPATLTGFQFKNTVSLLTGNGSIAPFETDPPTSTLQVCVTGGDDIRYSLPNSNITLVFGGPATTHFGMQAIHGVVRDTKEEGGGELR
ncbi:MAG TPA: hypothetical protein VK716_05100 [Terracidiphilus sp.]|jgi:hypothetical protein|nr:hypothetical protein [Terracidiphilus sp.]